MKKFKSIKKTKQTINYSIGDPIGILHLPKIDKELPIIEGAGQEELRQGVGHYPVTALPGENNQILLSGHRETVFKNLGKLKPGDVLIIETSKGRFHYLMESYKIVDADNTSVIKTNLNKEVLVLSTCYPFNFVGNAPKRYIIYATPLNEQKKILQD